MDVTLNHCHSNHLLLLLLLLLLPGINCVLINSSLTHSLSHTHSMHTLTLTQTPFPLTHTLTLTLTHSLVCFESCIEAHIMLMCCSLLHCLCYLVDVCVASYTHTLTQTHSHSQPHALTLSIYTLNHNSHTHYTVCPASLTTQHTISLFKVNL